MDAEQRAMHAEQRANRAIRQSHRVLGIGFMVVMISVAIFNPYSSYTEPRISRIKGAVSELEKAREDFATGNFSQLNALTRAMRMKTELQQPLEDLKWIPFVKTEQYSSEAKNDLKTIVESIREKNRLQVNSAVLGVHFNPERQNLAIVSSEGIRLWHWEGGEQPNKSISYKGNIATASFNSNGKTLATIATDGTIRLFDLQDSLLKPITEIKASSIGEVSSVSPTDRQLFATGSTDGIVRFWNLQGNQLAQFTGHQGAIWSMSFSPDGQYLATGSADGAARLWNLQGKQLTQFTGHQKDVLSVGFSPDGQYLATGSADGAARLWNLQGKQLTKLAGHQSSVLSLSFSSDRQQLVTGSAQGTVSLWNLQKKRSLEKMNLARLFDAGCSWLKDYLTTHPFEQQELAEQCPNPSLDRQQLQ